MKKYLSVILLLVFASAHSQSINENFSISNTQMTTIQIDPTVVYDSDGNRKGMSYSEISGSPFLFDDWETAIVYDNNLKKIAVVKVKYNDYSGQIHFLNTNRQELVADKKQIKRVEVLKDTIKGEVKLVLEKGFSDNKNTLSPNQFVEVLNNGSNELLKQTVNKIIQVDSLFGTMKVNRFSTSVSYYLKTPTNCEHLKGLDHTEIVSSLPAKDVIAEFEKNNKHKLKKEKDIIDFLNYYNSKTLIL
ncbi:MAG: hypothetical protein KGL19_04155 [Bacteroidota bacterium]|nr:hypothetical protein [Bacteroidota bacterium]